MTWCWFRKATSAVILIQCCAPYLLLKCKSVFGLNYWSTPRCCMPAQSALYCKSVPSSWKGSPFSPSIQCSTPLSARQQWHGWFSKTPSHQIFDNKRFSFRFRRAQPGYPGLTYSLYDSNLWFISSFPSNFCLLTYW